MPDPKDIIQVLPIEKKVLAEVIQDAAHLMDCKVDGGISRAGGVPMAVPVSCNQNVSPN